MDDKNLHEYVWMRPPDGGDPVKVPADAIALKMWQGFAQCDEPAATKEGKK